MFILYRIFHINPVFGELSVPVGSPDSILTVTAVPAVQAVLVKISTVRPKFEDGTAPSPVLLKAVPFPNGKLRWLVVVPKFIFIFQRI